MISVRKRAVFDQFGEEGLKHGVPTGTLAVDSSEGAWTTGYTFHGDAEKVFRQFFGGDNPYQGNDINNYVYDRLIIHLFFLH